MLAGELVMYTTTGVVLVTVTTFVRVSVTTFVRFTMLVANMVKTLVMFTVLVSVIVVQLVRVTELVIVTAGGGFVLGACAPTLTADTNDNTTANTARNFFIGILLSELANLAGF